LRKNQNIQGNPLLTAKSAVDSTDYGLRTQPSIFVKRKRLSSFQDRKRTRIKGTEKLACFALWALAA
jgi:hypothetical protein